MMYKPYSNPIANKGIVLKHSLWSQLRPKEFLYRYSLIPLYSTAMSFNEPSVCLEVFAVVTENFNTKSFAVKAGSWGVWKVDLTGATPTSTLIENVLESGFFVGLTTFNNDTIFIAGAGKGSLYKMTIFTGDYSVVMTDPSMKAPASVAIAEGIHGIKYYNGDVYFSSTFSNTFSKVKIDPVTRKAGAVISILTGLQGPKDFAISSDRISYLAKGQILKITPDGKSSTVRFFYLCCVWTHREGQEHVIC